MKRLLLILALLTAAHAVQAEWVVDDNSDPMTDEVNRRAYLKGKFLNFASGSSSYPYLNVLCGERRIKLYVVWQKNVEETTSLQLRFDAEPLFEVAGPYMLYSAKQITAVNNDQAERLQLLPRLLNAKRLRARILLPEDRKSTAEFDLEGSRSPLARACREYMEAKHPKLLREIQQSPEYTDEIEAILSGEQARENAARSGPLDQWLEVIRQRVQRNWVRSGSARAGLECEVRVMQIPGGEVVDVRVGKCNGDSAVVRSIENAVYKASPLPPPPDHSLFQRNITFVFAPE